MRTQYVLNLGTLVKPILCTVLWNRDGSNVEHMIVRSYTKADDHTKRFDVIHRNDLKAI